MIYLFNILNDEQLNFDFTQLVDKTRDIKSKLNGWKLSNASDYVPRNVNYIVSKEGINTITVYLNMRVKQGNRTTTLCAMCQNLIYLNQNRSYSEILDMMLYLASVLKIDLNLDVIKSIVKSYYQYKLDGTLIGNANMIRYVIFNKNFSGNKRKIIAQYVGNKVKDKNLVYLKSVYNSLKGKITQKRLALESNLSYSTVRRHWKNIIKVEKKVKIINNKIEYFDVYIIDYKEVVTKTVEVIQIE